GYRLRRSLVYEGGVGLIQRDGSDLELKTRRRWRRRRCELHGFARRLPPLARRSPLVLGCSRVAFQRSCGTAHQRLEAQLPVAPAPHKQMHPVALHLGDRGLARRQIELSDRDAEIFPLHRLFFFVRRIHFEIRNRDVCRLRVHVEVIAREIRLHVGLRAELARRHRRRKKFLRERLQRRQIDLIDRHVASNMRLREIQRALDRERAAAVNVAVNVERRRRLPERPQILYSDLQRLERRRRGSRTAVVLHVHSTLRENERLQLKIHWRFRRRWTRHGRRLLRHVARRRWRGRWSARRGDLRGRTRRRGSLTARQ